MAVDFSTVMVPVSDLTNYINDLPVLLGLTKTNQAAELDVKVIYDLIQGGSGIPTSWVDPNVNLGTSDQKIPTQNAVKTYVDNHTGAPSGSAGGDLSGTYPNPSIGTGKVTQAKIDALVRIPNPNSLTINVSGVDTIYDGSSAKFISVSSDMTGQEIIDQINSISPSDLTINTTTHTISSSGGFYQASDRRFKSNLVELAEIDGIKLYSYILGKLSKQGYGVIADELREVHPELVCKDEEGYLSVNYQELHTIILAKILNKLSKL